MPMRSARFGDAPAHLVSALEELLGESDVRFCKIAAEGNRAFERGDDVLAAWLYEDALAEADSLFAAARTNMARLIAPIAYTIACNNVAEVKLRMGDRDAARELKLRAVDRLIAVAESQSEPHVLRLSCVRQLRHAIAFLAAIFPPGRAAQVTELENLLERYRCISADLAKIATTEMLEQGPPASSTTGPGSRSSFH